MADENRPVHPFPLPDFKQDGEYPYSQPLPVAVEFTSPGLINMPASKMLALIGFLEGMEETGPEDRTKLAEIKGLIIGGRIIATDSLDYVAGLARTQGIMFVSRPGADGMPAVVFTASGDPRIQQTGAALAVPRGTFQTELGKKGPGVFPLTVKFTERINENLPDPVAFCAFGTDCPTVSDDGKSMDPSKVSQCSKACTHGCPIQALRFTQTAAPVFRPTVTASVEDQDGHHHVAELRYNFTENSMQGFTLLQSDGQPHRHPIKFPLSLDQTGEVLFTCDDAGGHVHQGKLQLEAPVRDSLLYLEGCPDQICADYFDAFIGPGEATFTMRNGEAGKVIKFGVLEDMPDIGAKETYAIKDVEIFDTGMWHGMPWEDPDLDEVVENFHKLKGTVKPPLKLGHSNEILKATAGKENDSLPSVGWIDDLKRRGSKILADFSNLPKLIFDLIDKGGYKRVSSELFLDFVDRKTGTHYGKVLKAVSLLGGSVPEVKTLKDVALLYTEETAQESDGQPIVINFDVQGGQEMDETNELNSLREKLAKMEEADRQKDKMLADQSQVLARSLRTSRTQEGTMFFTEHANVGRLAPKQKDALVNLMVAIHDLQDAAGDKVMAFTENLPGKSAVEALKAFIGTFPATDPKTGKGEGQIDFGERTRETYQRPNRDGRPAGVPGTSIDEEEDGQKVLTFTDIKGDEYPVRGYDFLQKVKAYRKANPGVNSEDAFVAVQRQMLRA